MVPFLLRGRLFYGFGAARRQPGGLRGVPGVPETGERAASGDKSPSLCQIFHPDGQPSHAAHSEAGE